jgi:hypothetical protein
MASAPENCHLFFPGPFLDLLSRMCRASIVFVTDYAIVDRIIDHIKLSFVADKPPPAHPAYQEVLMAAEASTEHSS